MNNLYKYKRALLHVKDLQKAIAILDESISKLNPYKKYDSLGNTIVAMDCTKTLLEIHLKTQQRLVEKKGID